MTIFRNSVAFHVNEANQLEYIENISDSPVDVFIPSVISAGCKPGGRKAEIAIKILHPNLCRGLFKTITVSDQIGEISAFAFSNAKADTLVWPKSCKVIPFNCFADSSFCYLKNIEEVEKVEAFGFSNSNFSEINWPSKCSVIPSGCFRASSVKSVTGIDNVTCVEESAFNKAEIKKIVWPSGCSIIPPLCFNECSLESISNLNNVTEIQHSAFRDACNIEKIDLSKSIVSNISKSAFTGIDPSKIIFPYYLTP